MAEEVEEVQEHDRIYEKKKPKKKPAAKKKKGKK